MTGPGNGQRRDRRITVTDCPGGPLLVRGADEVAGPDGEVFPVTRPIVALCRCGRSRRQPWCDDSHRVGRRPEGLDGPGGHEDDGPCLP